MAMAGPLPRRIDHGQAKAAQLGEILEDLVATLGPGEKLPSERWLAERYGVARMTARRAVDRLVVAGSAYRVPGQGTFVADARLAQPEELTSFSEDMRQRGLEPSSDVLVQEVLAAPASIARQLEIAPDDWVLRIERVRRADGEPIAIERAHLPAGRFPGLEQEDLSRGSLYELLRRRWGVEIQVAEQAITAAPVADEEAELLGTVVGAPALFISRTTRDHDGLVVEWVRSVYRGDRYELRTRIQRRARGGPS